ncbi:hypothetical protein Zmor_000688 [Zophobas morio]|uniref:Uncharacterized protein n=1 Tax=Zophobas morio TaxID=2755281 RepID=A0AA38MNQ1_9CUCU|nr:hypothetical protein Zmor_000688 [Zophobas morio]
MCNARTLLQVICLSFAVIQIVDGIDFSPSSNYTRVRRQANRGNCRKPNFACKSGECIDEDKECDGTVDCNDASDESNACHRIKCPDYLFTCKYGACINKNLECDGKNDCRDGSDENTPNCRKTDQETPECKEGEFRCSSGQCIDQDNKCDGKAECDDHSDEIRATCWNVKCPGFTHRCKYGACVKRLAECNGVVECFDGSDEDPAICKNSTVAPPVTPAPVPPRPSPGVKGSCVLPQYPEFGKWAIVSANAARYSPGMSVNPGTTLRVECQNRYKLDGQKAVFCDNGTWSSEIGRCLKACKPRLSSSTVRVTCSYNDKETENCTDAVEGTLAKFKCAPFYEDLALKTKPVHICQDGEWDQPEPHCVPVCGQKTVEPTKLIVNGTDVAKGDYPWQVALYNKRSKDLICGGSLLSQRVILSAAHCITDEKGVMLSKEDYVVAVGKYYRAFDDSRDYNEAQFSELYGMFVADQYKGNIQNYLGDIAILVSKKIFTLSRRVQPVCLDRGQNYHVKDNTYGYVTGWGFTIENNAPSEVLKELKVPSVSLSDCQTNLPEDYDIYLTYDKMCAGYLEKGTSVCKGDSGGGLVFKHDGRYYVTGIVSLSPTSPFLVNGCDSQQYGLYTQVSKYINNFILAKLAEYKS